MAKFTGRSYDMCAVGAQDNAISLTIDEASAGAGAVLTMPATLGQTNYLTGVMVTGQAPVAAKQTTVTITGLLPTASGGTLKFQLTESVQFGASLMFFPPSPLPANGQNAAITVTLAAVVSGGLCTISLIGYQRPE